MNYPLAVAICAFMLMLAITSIPNSKSTQIIDTLPPIPKTTVLKPMKQIEPLKVDDIAVTTYVAPMKSSTLVQNALISEAEAKAFIYQRESGNNPAAINSDSGACSLGQSLPCSKLANICPNWKTDYRCDDLFFTNYAMGRYGSWGAAYQFWISHRWW